MLILKWTEVSKVKWCCRKTLCCLTMQWDSGYCRFSRYRSSTRTTLNSLDWTSPSEQFTAISFTPQFGKVTSNKNCNDEMRYSKTIIVTIATTTTTTTTFATANKICNDDDDVKMSKFNELVSASLLFGITSIHFHSVHDFRFVI